jgi:hypothetical protein
MDFMKIISKSYDKTKEFAVSGKDTINQKIKDKSLYQKKECRIFNCKR